MFWCCWKRFEACATVGGMVWRLKNSEGTCKCRCAWEVTLPTTLSCLTLSNRISVWFVSIWWCTRIVASRIPVPDRSTPSSAISRTPFLNRACQRPTYLIHPLDIKSADTHRRTSAQIPINLSRYIVQPAHAARSLEADNEKEDRANPCPNPTSAHAPLPEQAVQRAFQRPSNFLPPSHGELIVHLSGRPVSLARRLPLRATSEVTFPTMAEIDWQATARPI